MRRATAGALTALLLVACQSDPALHSQRLGPGHYRLVADRCHVYLPAPPQRNPLELDLEALAARTCDGRAGPLEALQPIPSRQGSLFGECLRSGALRAEVRCQHTPPR
ncbi:hypothetical protein ACLB90_18550 [Stenotrophomonas sp. LGBM10]|uniref:hypothetical protein n=1 Tax=Stenotrophomonas sp. LGBM10 TaxID=3390038 RepID=UPI00398B3440